MTGTKRSYADPCGVSRALDAVGERWALLVVRELSLGPLRFSQLRTGLPDISPNVLSQRLRELEEAGVVRRYRLDPPASTTVYELTDRGHDLDPVLQALGRWGAREPEITSRELSPVSFLRSLRVLLSPGAPDVTLALDIDGEPFSLVIADGIATARRGRSAMPAVTLTADVATLRAVFLLEADPAALETAGLLRVSGDRQIPLSSLFALPPR